MTIRLRIPKDNDNVLCNFIVGYFAVQAINLFIHFIFGDIMLWTIVSRLFLATLLIIALPTMINRKAAVFIGSEFVLVVIYLLSFLGGSANNNELFSVAFNAVTVFLPMGICAFCIQDRELFLNKLYKISFVGQFLIIFTMYYFVRSLGRNYSISCSYALLLFLLVVLGKWFINHKWYNLVMCIVDLLVIVFFGSRGPLLCVVVFVIIACVVNPNIQLQKRIIYLVIIGVLGFLLIFHFQDIIIFLSDRLSAAGYSSRTLRLALQSELLTHDSGRQLLYDFYLAQIQKRPIFGWGILGGRTSLYPHNIYIELMLSFGITIGSILFIAIIIIMIRGIIQKNRINQLLAAIFISNGISLLYSGSVFTNAEFFICMAFCMAQSKQMMKDTQYSQQKIADEG